ncbi:hypothetical protein Bb109J_c2028 [Bdellovibrio bacteriovorus]|uniref:hypothetical protein n=1 Tax=Bdellovibrio bacteriovorus TaxID=959 RepID=UPI00045BE1F8|nr:hypothetical protein [Bdellovibrio bacteriovorus]AHZ84720.1 hypothetical protein EP01_07185 [Bdellovibrio bacteriovorus]BEV68608.1 hypothetical protein Bb109J_c2028 [Bdellovibrio bacteriovorus]
MKTDKDWVELVLSRMKRGQEHLQPQIEKAVQEQIDMPERLWVYYALSILMRHPEQTRWDLLMAELESLIQDETQGDLCEIIYQEVLETFANAISNQSFEHHWITPHIGPLSRDYIQAYDKFMGGKTPGF